MKDEDRRAAIVMSLLGAVGFGAAGVYALWNHSITFPTKGSGLQTGTGTSADIMGWVLLAASAAMLAHFAMAVRPGKVGGWWAVSLMLTWAIAAAVYFAARR
ncbi:hypothetical protein [Ramlibacter sp. PS4R-6]|uniref:hypothetical protein n=1 Tax=Ramlibacter sp. PS4R-6 TaxID=3133438 RepID=UPI0030A1567C